jgi:hypothetical protein
LLHPAEHCSFRSVRGFFEERPPSDPVFDPVREALPVPDGFVRTENAVSRSIGSKTLGSEKPTPLHEPLPVLPPGPDPVPLPGGGLKKSLSGFGGRVPLSTAPAHATIDTTAIRNNSGNKRFFLEIIPHSFSTW